MIHVAVTIAHVTVQTGTDAPWSPDVWSMMLSHATQQAREAAQDALNSEGWTE